MKYSLPVTLCAFSLALVSGSPGFAQGLSEGASLWGASGFGAGVGASYAASSNRIKKNTSPTGGTNKNAANSNKSGAKGNSAQASAVKTGGGMQGAHTAAIKHENMGNHLEAARAYSSYAEQREQMYGSRDPEVLKAYDKATSLANQAGKKAEASRYAGFAMDVCGRSLGVNSDQYKQRKAKLEGTSPNTATAAPPPTGSTTSADPVQTADSSKEQTAPASTGTPADANK